MPFRLGGFFLLLVALFSPSGWAKNGPFSAPTYQDFKALTPSQRIAYEARFDFLASPQFLKKWFGDFPSYYTTSEGRRALRQAAGPLYAMRGNYSRIVFIGRSGTAISGYLQALVDGTPGPEFGDLPFSYSGAELTSAEREALRRHLKRNGLDPDSIVASAKPILLFDFVYSGQGAGKVVAEILMWATEKKLQNETKKNLHFLGYFPALIKANEIVMGIYLASLKELRGAKLQKPTAEEIVEQAKGLTSNYFSNTQTLVGQAWEPHIHPDLYNYAATHGPEAHQSFVRSEWDQDPTGLPENSFVGKADDNGYLDLYYVMHLGEQDRIEAETKTCANPLNNPVFTTPLKGYAGFKLY